MPNAINATFALAGHHGAMVHSGDIPAAYVQAPVPDGDTIYYIEQPKGFVDKEHPDWIYKLNKCLYGIPCSGKQWNMTLAKFLVEEVGMKRLDSDPAVFFIKDRTGFLLMPCVVDDTLDVSTSASLREKVHAALTRKFRWKDLGPTTWYLGMRVTQSYTDIVVDQTAFLKEILEKFDKLYIKNYDTPSSGFLVRRGRGEDRFPLPIGGWVPYLAAEDKTRHRIFCLPVRKVHVESHEEA